MWSRYTVSTFVDRKKPANIIDALMTQWIGKFGVMRALMTDNGGEFNSDEMRDITSVLNVQLCTTAGEKKSKRKAMTRNWSNQKANPALKTNAGNK